MAWSIVQGVSGFALYLGLVLILLRACARAEPAKIVVNAAFGGWVLTLALSIAIGQSINFWAFSTAYWFLALNFLMAFGAIYKSISFRLVAHLNGKPHRDDTYEALRLHVLEQSYRERLTLIAEKGYAHHTGERFRLTRKGQRLASWLRHAQRIYRIERSG